MPKALHLFYLRRFYKENAFAKGQMTLLGEKLSAKDIMIPVYLQAAREDHIAPYPSVYKTAQLFGGPTTFMMSGSGHIAGVINHPDARRYQHWTNAALPASVEQWMAGATETPGSWWPDWDRWLDPISGPQVPARTPGDGKLAPIADAPGDYVKIRSTP
jgi:polyhydroxyalkanoate synthase